MREEKGKYNAGAMKSLQQRAIEAYEMSMQKEKLSHRKKILDVRNIVKSYIFTVFGEHAEPRLTSEEGHDFLAIPISGGLVFYSEDFSPPTLNRNFYLRAKCRVCGEYIYSNLFANLVELGEALSTPPKCENNHSVPISVKHI